MPNQILQVDENMLETKLDRLVSRKVEQLLNASCEDAEADGPITLDGGPGSTSGRAGHRAVA